MRAVESDRTGSVEMSLFQTFVDGKSGQGPDWVGAGVGGAVGGAVGGFFGGFVGGAVGGVVGGVVGGWVGGCVGGWVGGCVGGWVGGVVGVALGRAVGVGRGVFDGFAAPWAAARSAAPTSGPGTPAGLVAGGVATITPTTGTAASASTRIERSTRSFATIERSVAAGPLRVDGEVVLRPAGPERGAPTPRADSRPAAPRFRAQVASSRRSA